MSVYYEKDPLDIHSWVGSDPHQSDIFYPFQGGILDFSVVFFL